MSGETRMVPYDQPRRPVAEIAERASEFYNLLNTRRSVRAFSTDPVPQRIVELAIQTASTAPSGANRQPWTFALIGDPIVKSRIRKAAEAEESDNYEGGRLPAEWRLALEPLGTGSSKPYLEDAPWLVVLFEQRYGIDSQGETVKNYYVKESVGIAAGIFVAAIHQMGLVTLTHTPSPMAFLSRILDRPENERPFALFPVGYPAADCTVPDLKRKSLDEIVIHR